MKIATFNTQHCLNYLEQRIDFDLMAKVILDLDADVVGLNEMRGAGEDPEYTAQTEELAARTGMHCFFAPAIEVPNGGPYGNAILSRVPILSVERVPIPDPAVHRFEGHYESRIVLKAVLEGGITVLISHFGLQEDEAENAVSTVLDLASDEKCILMGDFNLPPESPLLLPIRERMQDAASAFDGEKLSWPSDAPKTKIDYIFLSRDARIVSADIPAIVASDHRPHIAEIEL